MFLLPAGTPTKTLSRFVQMMGHSIAHILTGSVDSATQKLKFEDICDPDLRATVNEAGLAEQENGYNFCNLFCTKLCKQTRILKLIRFLRTKFGSSIVKCLFIHALYRCRSNPQRNKRNGIRNAPKVKTD